VVKPGGVKVDAVDMADPSAIGSLKTCATIKAASVLRTGSCRHTLAALGVSACGKPVRLDGDGSVGMAWAWRGPLAIGDFVEYSILDRARFLYAGSNTRDLAAGGRPGPRTAGCCHGWWSG
jgi:hypothetical protein